MIDLQVALRRRLPGRRLGQPAGPGADLASRGHPTLVIWGDQDRYLGRELAQPDRAWVPDVRVERITEASHWVQADAPERVTQLMLPRGTMCCSMSQQGVSATNRP